MGAFYSLFVPPQAAGANLVYFDFFNASGSAKRVKVHSVVPVVSGIAAVTGVLGIDLFLTRTSAVGTGGTAATREGTALNAATFTAIDNQEVLSASITARLTPSGGATAGAVISWDEVFTEETNAGTYEGRPNMLRRADSTDIPPLQVVQGTGFRVVQSATGTVGNIGFNVIFSVDPD